MLDRFKFWQSPLDKELKSLERLIFVECGHADVLIVETDGTEHEICFHAEHAGQHPMRRSEPWIFDAEFYFRAWQERNGKTGTVAIGDGQFVPLCNIKKITVEYSPKEIPVK